MSNVKETLSRRTKLMYGVGDAGINLADTMVGLLFAIFLTGVVGPSWVGGAGHIHRAHLRLHRRPDHWLSLDRTRSRWGRRRPFILFGMFPFALAYTLLWWIPPFTTQQDSQSTMALPSCFTILWQPFYTCLTLR